MVEFSRRHALAGAVALPLLATGCSPNGNPGQFKPTNLLKIGEHGRIRGVNIAPGPDDWDGDSPWAELWSTWDWDGRIKDEVDDAVSVGANCLRLIGNTHVVTSGALTEEVYLQRWTQFLDYAKSRGLWVYPCGGDLSHWGDTTLKAAEDLYNDWAVLLSTADHVVGVDVTNEAPEQSRIVGGIAYHEPESWYYTIKCLGEILRATSKKPITHSRSVAKPGAGWQFGSPETDLISDFLDVHVYAVDTPNDADPLYTSGWGAGKQLILGEFGTDMTVDSTSRTSFYYQVKELINHSANCVGGLAWAVYDAGTIPVSQPGLYDGSRTLREDIAKPFVTFPTTR
jgi:hypothetical protein